MKIELPIQLYKRSQKNSIVFWSITEYDDVSIHTISGELSRSGIHRIIPVTYKGGVLKEIAARVAEKEKIGYKSIKDLSDKAEIDWNDGIDALWDYLHAYLPKYNTTDDGEAMPMLAKVFQYDKLKYPMLAQPKINGLRALVKYAERGSGLFKSDGLVFRSREGNVFDIPYIEDIVLNEIKHNYPEIYYKLKHTAFELDGELYIHGCSVNDINHYVKTKTSTRHKELRYICYDIACEMEQIDRFLLLNGTDMDIKNIHVGLLNDLQNKSNKFIPIHFEICHNDNQAAELRDKYVKAGFEGAIFRKPESLYQFGKRNNTMIKFKPTYEGLFQIINIIKEPKRDTPIFVCRNDLNHYSFEVLLKGAMNEKREFLINKELYIGMYIEVEYRERSGITKVPFHAVGIRIVKNPNFVLNEQNSSVV